MPAIVDGLVTGLGFSNPDAGMVGAANIYGASVGSFIAIFLVGRLRWKPTLAALFCVLIAIDLASLAIRDPMRSEEHTSELQSLMRISYAVFCLKKNRQT